MGYVSSQTPLLEMSADTTSPIYPDRPIRPLPKRRLRERLSPEAAGSIEYPPVPHSTSPLFYYPFSSRDDATTGAVVPSSPLGSRDTAEPKVTSRSSEEDSDEDDLYRSRMFSRHSPDKSGRSYRYVAKQDAARPPKPPTPASTTSSADGYDSFENTNNKKKRKVPSQGDGFVNGVHLSNDLANMGISTTDDVTPASPSPAHYYSPESAVAGIQGISGSGRGRFGRVSSGRSPLRALSDATNNWTGGRSLRARQSQWTAPNEAPGIISTAIANAERQPVTPPQGQENVSLLQQFSKKTSPAQSQFTFTCDSQVPGTMAWPCADTSFEWSGHSGQSTMGVSTSTQTSPRANSPSRYGKQLSAPDAMPASGQPGSVQATKKNRRRPGRDFAAAARARREQQEYVNAQHRFDPQDTWICEFCEYESIFGCAPEALIRQYEIKDARVRKQEAERRRLLEKAKMKGRKGKKSTKAASKQMAQDRQTSDGSPHLQSTQSQSQGTQSEDNYDDDYDDEFGPDEPHVSSPRPPAVAAYGPGASSEFAGDHRHLSSGPPRNGEDPTIRVH